MGKNTTDLESDILKEFAFDIKSSKRIVGVIYDNPVSLKECANILEALVPYIDAFTLEGVIQHLERLISGD